MSDTISGQDVLENLRAEDVITWLRQNPDFLQKHPQVLDILAPPRENTGRNIADFQSYLIERLQADKEQVLATTQEIVETSRANMSNQSRIQKAILHLLESRTLDELIHKLTMDLNAILGIDISTLLVESNGHDIPHVHFSGVRVLPPGTIDSWMEGKTILLQDQISGIEAIYGGGASLVQSQLLMRLEILPDTPPALVAFGSRDPDLFRDGLGTEHVRFLAGVIERILRRRLEL